MAADSNTVKVALVQAAVNDDPAGVLAGTLATIRRAAAAGAQIVCLQELFLTRYFCRVQDPQLFDLAEPIPGPTTAALAEVARECGVVVIGSLFEARATGLYHNTAVVIDADGTVLGRYRKMHIPQDPGFEEKFYFTPGDTGFRVWKTRYGVIGVLVCWDQWYPEAARLAALKGAKILFYPTAIGWLETEKSRLGSAQHTAWETVQRGHAVANGCYVAAVNRVGVEDEIEFWGQSFVANPYGEIIGRAATDRDELLFVDCDMDLLEDFRRIWPFFRDRRIDAYADILKRFDDDSE